MAVFDSGPEVLRPAVRALLDQIAVPALAIGQSRDNLGWNALGYALMAGHLPRSASDDPGERPNLVRLVFLDPASRSLYDDWEGKAQTGWAT